MRVPVSEVVRAEVSAVGVGAMVGSVASDVAVDRVQPPSKRRASK
jgi:hypothetical protein